jgi:putative membrane protein insertion efficiency factor
MISGFFKSIFILPIRIYQIFISPVLRNVFGMSCRYEPSCSYYTIDAIREWGVIKGLYLGSKRILSCNPWGGHGHDPVPKNPKKQ